GAVLNATNPDLRSFCAEGGKLLQYHGWGDSAISALSSIESRASARSFHDFWMEEAKPPARLRTSIACSWCLEWVTAGADTVRTDSIRSRRLKHGSKKALRRNRCWEPV